MTKLPRLSSAMLSLSLLVLISLPQVVEAKDMRGKLGVGAIRSLSGAEGMSLRYWATREFGVELLTGISVLDRDAGDTRVGLAGGIQALYVLREIGRANLNVGLRLTVGYLNELKVQNTNDEDEIVEEEEATVHFATELPLTLEYHFADAFSVQLSTGIVVSFIPDDGPVLNGQPLLWGGDSKNKDPESGVAFGLGSGGLFGTAGFTYYF